MAIEVFVKSFIKCDTNFLKQTNPRNHAEINKEFFQ